MGVHVLDAVQLLQLPREVPVHDFHLGLQPVGTEAGIEWGGEATHVCRVN